MKKMFLLMILIMMTSSCQRKFEKIANDKLRSYKEIGLKNYKMEKTTKSAVNAYFSKVPSLPHYKEAKGINDNKQKFSTGAEKFSKNDKVRHCYMGFVIAKKYSYKAAVFVGYFKEAQDVGDSRRGTHFEVKDKRATVFGAKLAMGAGPLERCHSAESLFL